jgi:triosephosphate isomerase
MRLPMIAGNWKMNATVSEAVELVNKVRKGLSGAYDVEVVVCPPFVSLMPVKEALKGTSIKLGAQNIYFEEKGAYTGEISPLMLVGLCEYIIIGHSERRQHFGDSDDVVNKKLGAVLKAGMKPVLCVGEKLEENEAGKTNDIVTGQVRSALAGVDCYGELVVAYEPIWAIGTGRAAHGKQVNDTVRIIRSTLAELYGRQMADDARVLYGGSVTADNIAEFMEQSEIDGALVGGASLKADQFSSIVRQTEEIFYPNNPPTKDLIPW